jgi:hypothetical protein
METKMRHPVINQHAPAYCSASPISTATKPQKSNRSTYPISPPQKGGSMHRQFQYASICTFALFIVLNTNLAVRPARADTMLQINDPSTVTWTDSLDWGTLGISSSYPQPVPNGFGATSAHGISFNGYTNADFERVDDGNGFNGDFPLGDRLLFNQGSVMNMNFLQTPISGIGFNIDPVVDGNYTVYVTAANLAGDVLGTATLTGYSNDNVITHGPPSFVGIWDQSGANIFGIQIIATYNGPFGDEPFAIDTMLLNPTVPEPSMLGLVCVAGLALRRRQGKRPVA